MDTFPGSCQEKVVSSFRGLFEFMGTEHIDMEHMKRNKDKFGVPQNNF